MAQSMRPDTPTPRFDYYPGDGQGLKSVPVKSFPFTIGRGDGVGLKINSGCVSREHAVLTQDGHGFKLQDLGSMNGTVVNGQAITETRLNDGDSVGIADIELAFVCSTVGRLERMATQALNPAHKPRVRPQLSNDVAAARSMQEALLWQTLPLQWTSIAARTTRLEYARIVVFAGPHVPFNVPIDADEFGSTSLHARNLAWTTAAEQIQPTSTGPTLLLRIAHQSELNGRLFHALEDVSQSLPDPCRLGVVLSWNWTSSSTSVAQLGSELVNRGYSLAIDGFSGGIGSIDEMQSAPPDFLVMDKTVVRGVAEQKRRYQRLESVTARCEEIGILPVTPDGVRNDDEIACRQLGLDLVKYSHSVPVVEDCPQDSEGVLI